MADVPGKRTETFPRIKPCRACCHPLPAKANKCIRCDSIQNWQRHLAFSGTILGLLVALISVLTFAVPILSDRLLAKTTRPQAALVGVDPSGLVTFAVSNDGTAPGALEYIYIQRASSTLLFDLGGVPTSSLVVRPGEVKVFRLTLEILNDEDEVWTLVKMRRDTGPCSVGLGMLPPDGQRVGVLVNISSVGMDDKAGGCDQKIAEAFEYTLRRLGDTPAFVPTLCAVARHHPIDPSKPRIGSRCAALGQGR